MKLVEYFERYGKRCPKCVSGQITSDNSSVLNHTCLNCGYMFTDKDAVRPAGRLLCSKCLMRFQKPERREKHMLKCKGKRCRICGHVGHLACGISGLGLRKAGPTGVRMF